MSLVFFQVTIRQSFHHERELYRNWNFSEVLDMGQENYLDGPKWADPLELMMFIVVIMHGDFFSLLFCAFFCLFFVYVRWPWSLRSCLLLRGHL